jgi:uncharacterized membrane protein
MGAHFLLILMTALFRHWGYLTSINDLGVFDQAIWGLLNGEPFLNTILFNQKINWLAVHFHPVLLIFAPFYLLYSSPFWLILAQALALSLSAWPIYLLAKRVNNSDKTALIWAVIFLVNPFLLNASVWDFHPITLAVPFVALGFLAVETKNFKIMICSALVILLCKEHLGIMVVGFGFLWFIKNRQWKPSIALVIIGFVHFYVVLNIIMPFFSPTGQHIMISMESRFNRYGWLGPTINDIVSTILFHPYFVLKKIFIQMGGSIYLFLLLLPFIGFSILGWPYLFPAAADLAVNMLSANPMPRSPISYHSVTLVPILTVAAIYGIKKASKWINRFTATEISGLILVVSIVTGYLLAPFPLPAAVNYWAPVCFMSRPDSKIEEIQALLGEDTSISAQANVAPHFSQRKEIYQFPNKTESVDAIILWLETPTKNVHNNSGKKENRRFIMGMLDNHLQMDRVDFVRSIEMLLKSKEFSVVYWNDPWLVLKRGDDNHQDVSGIRNKLEKLRREW